MQQDGDPKDVTETYMKDMYEEKAGTSAQREEPKQEQVDLEALNTRDMRADLINAVKYRNDIEEVFAFNEESASLRKKALPLPTPFAGWPGAAGQLDCGRGTRHPGSKAGGPPGYRAGIVGFLLRNRYGQHLLATIPITYRDGPLIVRKGQRLTARFSFTMPILEKGDYSISIAVAEGTQAEKYPA